MADIRLTDVIAPSFYSLHNDIAAERYTHHWLPGGRGSTKSSFASVELVLSIMRDGENGEMTHGLALRRYSNTLRESVFEQMLWAIDALGASHLWKSNVSPMKLIYKPTGQSVIFRGVDDATKLKSIKVRAGYVKYLWVEEATEFEGPEKLRSVLQSVMRGGSRFCCFYSFNPPKAAANWVNRFVNTPKESMVVYRTNYLTVPQKWLGKSFIAEAEHLKKTNFDAYRHEYLGEVVGTGGEVFDNIKLEKISDQEIAIFDNLRRGIDWGYAADPFAYNVCHYDKTRRRLYIFYELHKIRFSNRAAAEAIKQEAQGALITCDSAEPKSIDEMQNFGLWVKGAKKGPDSIEYGVKWLQDLEAIIIDPDRCPETAKEFSSYELDRDREGNFKEGYPDHHNHHIDAVRYACESDMKNQYDNYYNKYEREQSEIEAFANFGR